MHGNNTNIKIENHDSHLLEGYVAKMSSEKNSKKRKREKLNRN